MSLFDLQDVCIAIGSIATLDLPMVVDLIGIYGLKGPYCTLTTTNWFLQALSVIPRGSWGDVARRSYRDPLGSISRRLPPLQKPPPPPRVAGKSFPDNFDEENPFVVISSVLLVQADEGVLFLAVDRIGDFYRNLPRRADVIVTTVGARHKCQQAERLVETRSDTEDEMETTMKEESEPLSKVLETYVSPTSDYESLSLEEHLAQIPDGMMLPSITAAEPTKIKLFREIKIRGIEEGDWYKAKLPKIVATDKGKKALEELDTVKGHPAHEQFQLICGDIDFLILLWEQVITEMTSFFQSEKSKGYAVSQGVTFKEEKMLVWAETDSLNKAVQRRMFIFSKQLYDPTNLFLMSKRSYFKHFELAPEITLIISTYIHRRCQELRLEKRLEEFTC
ncbi:hypothetical protein F511_14100 [Dorcoceras hygrometricum]|uniref:Uncharacterized protein n=1 Tax=Dorcoceras hygrometricum TaxID=472368 RepID=A0A2Z7CH52_9LAMI|nr:hypothetical protein F511_14100 [Dorcoceras hygrometricum]